MKELSIEEKAKRYDEAVINGSRLWECGEITRGNYEYIFPELKESEDEKTIKEIKQFIRSRGMSLAQSKVDSWIAWLEKQSKKNLAEWHREDEQNLNACLGYIQDEFLRRWLTDVVHIKYDKPVNEVLKQKPWSEEDKMMLQYAIEHFERQKRNCIEDGGRRKVMQEFIDWLKSLKDRFTWKPSEEQMEVLLSEVKGWTKGCPKQIVLESLYNDLMKLKS